MVQKTVDGCRAAVGGRRLAFCLGLLAASWVPVARAQSEPKAPQGAQSSPQGQPVDLAPLVAELEQVCERIDANLSAQARAWPRRDQERLEETPPPPAVRKLQDELAGELGRKKALILKLRWEARPEAQVFWLQERGQPVDLQPLARALERSRSVRFVEELTPVAVDLMEEDASLGKALQELALRFDPTPQSVVDGLARVGGEDAGLFLLDLARKRGSLTLMRGAAETHSVAVWDELVTLAESRSDELADEDSDAELALQAMRRVRIRDETPASSEVAERLVGRLPKLESDDVKTVLLGYVGGLRDPVFLSFLQSTYHAAESEPVRIAALAAVAALGGPAKPFLVTELGKEDNPRVVRRMCIERLADLKHVGAVPLMIAALDDPELAWSARRALRDLTGQRLGRRRAPWLRWWRQQPHAAAVKDPDD